MQGYLNRKQIMQAFGRSRWWVTDTLKGMEQSGRYGSDDIVYDGRLVSVDEKALRDYLAFRKAMKTGGLYPPYKKGTRK